MKAVWERGARGRGLWRDGKRLAFIGLPPPGFRVERRYSWSIDGTTLEGREKSLAAAKRCVEGNLPKESSP